jgi:hypothetical protein
LPEIWVLGSKNSHADKSVEWSREFPNFSNADVLIVNLESLHREKIDDLLEQALFNQARKYIFDMLMTCEKHVIVIVPSRPSKLNWLPIYPIYERVAKVKLGDKSQFAPAVKNYLKNVETCSYYFRDMDFGYFVGMTNPKTSDERYFFSDKAEAAYTADLIRTEEVENAAKQAIGGSFAIEIRYGKAGLGISWSYAAKFVSGWITFLPPPTKGNIENSIDLLIDGLRGETSVEYAGPGWELEIDVPGLSDLDSQLCERKTELKKLESNIQLIESQIAEKAKLRRLLWSDGKQLEMAVRDAFIILGFPEIRKLRAENLEDWVIDFKHVTYFKHAVFEVKASEKRTSMADLTQCNKWVEDYLLENIVVKGIFVSNQYRLIDVQNNRKERKQFASNELDYARKREICILPACEIFDAVVQKLTLGDKFTRELVEKKIAAANGLCTLQKMSAT